MSDEKDEKKEAETAEDPAPEASDEPAKQESKQDGPTFNEAPNPLDGVSKASKNIWDSMEGKTVSLRVYVGSIIGVIILMLLARCGG